MTIIFVDIQYFLFIFNYSQKISWMEHYCGGGGYRTVYW